MSAPTVLRPGLRFYPDAEAYDQDMRDLRVALGRAPTEEDIAFNLWPGFAMLAAGEPCIACGAKEATPAAAWRPNNVESLVGYACCKVCKEKHDAGDDCVDRGIEARRSAEASA